MARYPWRTSEDSGNRAGSHRDPGAPEVRAQITLEFLGNVRRLFAAAELVVITEPVTGCRDPDDDKFLELAVNGNADVIVSGDADLLVLGTFRGIPIVTPAVFARARAP